jgi:hypothetical protein
MTEFSGGGHDDEAAQREELRARILREQEEVEAQVNALLEEYGVVMPPTPAGQNERVWKGAFGHAAGLLRTINQIGSMEPERRDRMMGRLGTFISKLKGHVEAGEANADILVAADTILRKAGIRHPQLAPATPLPETMTPVVEDVPAEPGSYAADLEVDNPDTRPGGWRE